MREAFKISPAIQHAWIAIRQWAVRRRPDIALSVLTNAALTVGFGLLWIAADIGTHPEDRYPLAQTMRPAMDRPLVMLDAKGSVFAKRGDCIAEPVTFEDVPKHFVDALLAMEDRRFYSHPGLDPIGILRAAKTNYEADRIVQGGSTLTQQLVKNSYLSRTRTMDRKATEALLAMWLEVRLSKEEILERYINSAYFGKGCYGLRAAAKRLFDKPVDKLTLAESAYMVALLRSPTLLSRDYERASARAKLVLAAMASDGRIAASRLAEIAPAKPRETEESEIGGYYADWLAESLKGRLPDPHSREPLIVRTTFRTDLQRMAEDTVRDMLEKRGKRRNAGQASLVAMRTDGRIVAMVGGKDRSISQFNRAVQARRQPGSAFKAFVYLAALRAGVETDMRVRDEPISIGDWEPDNYTGDHRGSVTLKRAFARSINTVAVQLSEAVGREAVIEAARDLGIQSPLLPVPSIALGTFEVSLLELTSAYASIAAGAYPVKPWGAAAFGSGSAAGATPPAEAGRWKLEEADAMREFMAGVTRSGSGHRARLPIATYGKTGTSQGYRDGWFIGFAGNLVVGVWVGNDDDTPMKGVTGGRLPARIWRKFMRQAMTEDPEFQKDLPQIAAFEAHPPERKASPGRLSALLDLQSGQSTTYGHVTSSGSYGRRQDDGRQERYSRRVREREVESRRSRDFQSQLDDMGWP